MTRSNGDVTFGIIVEYDEGFETYTVSLGSEDCAVAILKCSATSQNVGPSSEQERTVARRRPPPIGSQRLPRPLFSSRRYGVEESYIEPIDMSQVVAGDFVVGRKVRVPRLGGHLKKASQRDDARNGRRRRSTRRAARTRCRWTTAPSSAASRAATSSCPSTSRRS